VADLLPGFGRFHALTERDRPDLVQRSTNDDLRQDSRRYGVTSRLLARAGHGVRLVPGVYRLFFSVTAC